MSSTEGEPMNEPQATDACAWCGDYRLQHDEMGSKIGGRYPWERGIYTCDGFVEKKDADKRGRRLERALRRQRGAA